MKGRRCAERIAMDEEGNNRGPSETGSGRMVRIATSRPASEKRSLAPPGCQRRGCPTQQRPATEHTPKRLQRWRFWPEDSSLRRNQTDIPPYFNGNLPRPLPVERNSIHGVCVDFVGAGLSRDLRGVKPLPHPEFVGAGLSRDFRGVKPLLHPEFVGAGLSRDLRGVKPLPHPTDLITPFNDFAVSAAFSAG